MRIHERCSRCYHVLPPGKRTWHPRWQVWAGSVWNVPKRKDDTTIVYAGDGPSLGAIGKRDNSLEWEAWVKRGKDSMDMTLLGHFRYQCDAKKAVENVVFKELWP